jgi:hypothetical protein
MTLSAKSSMDSRVIANRLKDVKLLSIGSVSKQELLNQSQLNSMTYGPWNNRFPGNEFIAFYSEYFQSLLAQEDCSELLSSLALRLAELDSVNPAAIPPELYKTSRSFDA